jgi:exo-beta-1,3-glucanase (GH17 family)
MAPVPSNFVMGMNFSTAFQSKPIDPKTAANQIAPLVKMLKTFSVPSADFYQNATSTNPLLTFAVGTSNDDLVSFANDQTKDFINKILPFKNKISWICVGNEPLGSWYNGQYNKYLAPAVKNLHAALKGAGLSGIGVTVPQNFEFMAASYPPSAGAIKPELVDIIKGTCAIMKESGAPFMVNIYPFITRVQNRDVVPLDYCLFTAGSDHWVSDPPYTYKNIFDAMIDALYVALGKIGYGDLEIVIGECGWPTAGDVDANDKNAQTFLQNLITHCKSGAGTPRLPSRGIRCFVFEAYDEDLKSTAPGPFETHWGVYDGGGKLKFPLQW